MTMTHAHARKLLDSLRHGIPVCTNLAAATALLHDALVLLEDDRRVMKDCGINVFVDVVVPKDVEP